MSIQHQLPQSKSKRYFRGIGWYITTDFLMASLSWASFFVYRKLYIEPFPFNTDFLHDANFLYGIVLLPIIWWMLYAILDSYRSIYRMSRMAELWRTLLASVIGSLLIFFVFILDDLRYYADGYKSYYAAFGGLFCLHFGLTWLGRFIVVTIAKHRVKKGKIRFKALVIGNPASAQMLLDDAERYKLGYEWVGLVSITPEDKSEEQTRLDYLGHIKQLEAIIQTNDVEEVILALKKGERRHLRHILSVLERYRYQVHIKVIPDMYDILLGKVKMTHVYGTALIEIAPRLMPLWFRVVKRTMDITASILVLLLLAPLYAFVAYKVRRSSKGPIFYKQKRIGLQGKPFMIYKFRSMYTDAEKHGPQLSKDADDRCTPWGRTMRKYRLDEIPQFWNVLKGDMSLVGPRPERKFYLEQIAEEAPHVYQLLRVRPGITSWGQVKYGYASDVNEMLERLKYDILYIENISLALDIKIMFYTVLVVFRGSGK